MAAAAIGAAHPLCRLSNPAHEEGRCSSGAAAGSRLPGRAGISARPPITARGAAVLARGTSHKAPLVFDFDEAKRTGLAWGDWQFTGGGGRYSDGGGGGGSGGNGYGDGGYYHRGFGTAAAFFFLGAKTLVSWCSEDAKSVATVMDLGYLLTMAMLSFVALSASPLALLQPVRVSDTINSALY